MNLYNNLNINNCEEFNLDYEVVERKGLGHPDTLCDVLAEKISARYSQYCLKEFGYVLRHMVDKLSILGGSAVVRFGSGEIVKPFRILLNGRFASVYGNVEIPYLKIAKEVIEEYLREVFVHIKDVSKIYEVVDNTHSSPGPGVVMTNNNSKNERLHFFDVPNAEFLKNHANHNRANDTSTVVAYTTPSIVEKLALEIEKYLSSAKVKQDFNFIGYDIKVMVCRVKDHIKITSCVPLIAEFVNSKEDYKLKLQIVHNLIKETVLSNISPSNTYEIFINTRDNFENDDLYLTFTGSATESGDEGVVGRGNRYNGLIAFNRHITLEACCGKNPIYHVGKIYMAVAKKISEQIFNDLNISNVVYISSQMGADLQFPNYISVNLDRNLDDIAEIRSNINNIVKHYFDTINEVSLEIISEHLKLY
jgi:S-adenosylmethionine synthetase